MQSFHEIAEGRGDYKFSDLNAWNDEAQVIKVCINKKISANIIA